MVMIIAMLVMTAMVKMMTDDFHGDVDHGLDGHAVMMMVMLRMMIVMMILMRMTLVMTMTNHRIRPHATHIHGHLCSIQYSGVFIASDT